MQLSLQPFRRTLQPLQLIRIVANFLNFDRSKLEEGKEKKNIDFQNPRRREEKREERR